MTVKENITNFILNNKKHSSGHEKSIIPYKVSYNVECNNKIYNGATIIGNPIKYGLQVRYILQSRPQWNSANIERLKYLC